MFIGGDVADGDNLTCKGVPSLSRAFLATQGKGVLLLAGDTVPACPRLGDVAHAAPAAGVCKAISENGVE